jgi:acetyltransferase
MKNLDKIFNPKSVAIIGASAKEKTVGFGLAGNALLGKDERKIYFVNPGQGDILGNKVFAKITDIQEEIDLAVVAVPAAVVAQVVEECCQKKVGGIIVVSAGFAETGKEGKSRQDDILEKAKIAGIPLVGPNCLGVIRTNNNLNVSFAPSTPEKGNIGFISQSGALLDSVVDNIEDLGLSYAISYGNEADVDLIDFMEWLAEDKDTKVIALYLEAINDGKKFMEVARRITKIKPVIAIKAGKFESVKGVVKSHTGSMAGDYSTYKAVFKQTGIIEADSIEEMFDIAKLLAWQPKCQNSFAVVTNGGGCGVLASDYCKTQGINLAKLSKETIDKISGFAGMNAFWSKSNPVDIIGDASPERYQAAIEAVLGQKNVGGLIVIQAPQIMTNPIGNAKVILEAKRIFPEKPIICFFLGGEKSEESIRHLEENNIPNYGELKRGILAIKSLIK